MKNFNYTARDKTGSTKRGSLKAADRNAAMQELSAQGMVPLSITEGVAQPGNRTIKPVHALMAGVAALIIIGVVIVVLFPKSITPKTSAKKAASSKTPSAVNAQRNKKPVQLKVPGAATNAVIASVTATNSINSSVTNNPIEGTASIPEVATNIPPRKMFSTGVEQVISLIVNTRPGSPVPPLLRLHSKENVMDILNRDIVLYEEDNELTAEKKANVAHAKQLMKDYIAQGGKPDEFLAFFHGELKKAHTEWREAQVQAVSLFKGDDQEAAQKYFEETNRTFTDKGMKPITKPAGIQ